MAGVVVLLSGGMDSVTVLYHALQECEVLACLSFNYGAKHNAREIPFASHHCQVKGIQHEVVSLDFVNSLFKSNLLQSGGEIPEGHYTAENMKQTVVPFRNGIMLSIAAGYAGSIGAEGIIIAAHAGDHTIYPDCREDFMEKMERTIGAGMYSNTAILRPFIAFDKAKIVSHGVKLGVDYGKTWSCYKGERIHCGSCGTCVERREAFINASVPDPTQYLVTTPLPERPKAEGVR